MVVAAVDEGADVALAPLVAFAQEGVGVVVVLVVVVVGAASVVVVGAGVVLEDVTGDVVEAGRGVVITPGHAQRRGTNRSVLPATNTVEKVTYCESSSPVGDPRAILVIKGCV